MQTYLYTGRTVSVPPRNIVNGVSTMLVDFGLTSQQTGSNATGWNNISAVPTPDQRSKLVCTTRAVDLRASC